MMQYLNPSEQRGQATIVSIGLLTFVCVGVAACLALVAAAFYLAVWFVLVVLQGVVSACGMIGYTWAGSDPFIRLLILAALVYGGYWLYQRRKRGGKNASK